MTNDCPGGYYLVLKRKSMVPKYMPIVSIGYKCNYWKVLYFIATEYLGIINSIIPYLSNHPYQFDNVNILPVYCTLVVSRFLGSVNEVDSHNKSRQYDLE